MANPKRRRRRAAASPPRRRRARRNVPNMPRARRRYSGASRRRRYRRNPALALQFDRPMTWLPYLATGGIAATAAVSAPRFFGPGVTPMMAYAAQFGVALGGGFLIPMLGVAKTHGVVWFIGAGAIVVADMIGRYVMPMFGVPLSAYPYEANEMGQLPYYPPQLYGGGVSAYPYEAMEGVGQEEYEAVPSAPFEQTY